MRCPMRRVVAGLCIYTLLIVAPAASAQAGRLDDRKQPDTSLHAGRTQFTKAFIVDDRLSALRQDADIKSQVLRRLRVGRRVFIIESKSAGSAGPRFYRVAVTRRTRGWLHESALTIPGRSGEDGRLIKLITDARDGLDRIALCRLFLEQFGRSALAPRALLAMAEEASRASVSLGQNARKRLKDIGEHSDDLKYYYLSDAGLDRYSRLGIAFDFRPSTAEYVYDGKAYREIVKRFPHSPEAEQARKQLDSAGQRLARE
jgi:hypothetical protein